MRVCVTVRVRVRVRVIKLRLDVAPRLWRYVRHG